MELSEFGCGQRVLAVCHELWRYAKGAMAAGGLRREIREITVTGREGLSRRQTAKTRAEDKRDLCGSLARGAVFTSRSGKGKCFGVAGAKIAQ